MSRRNRRRSNADTSDIANDLSALLEPPSVHPVDTIVSTARVDPVSRLDEFLGPTLPYDRREFSFGDPEHYSLSVSSAGSMTQSRPQFNDPSTVAICHRREVRREVLFAKKRMRGRGGPRRRTWRSDYKC